MTPPGQSADPKSGGGDSADERLRVYMEVTRDPTADLDSLHDMLVRQGMSVLDYTGGPQETRDQAEARRQGFPRYLAALTRRRAIDRYRQQQRAGVGTPVPEPASQEDPIDTVVLQGKVLVLLTALDGLAPEDKSVLAERASGTSLAQIAREKGVTEEAIRKRHQRAIRRLRDAVREVDPSMLKEPPRDDG